MSTTKNFIMKQYNGTDYDRLNPATVVEQVDGYWDLTKVKNILSPAFGGTGVSSIDDLKTLLDLQKYPMFTAGFYIGTGIYGASNPNTLTFNFYPRFFMTTGDLSYEITWSEGVTAVANGGVSVKMSQSEKTLSWYSTKDVYTQCNVSGQRYYYIALGSPVQYNIEQLWTEPGTYSYTVPKTGKYYLELHAGGGTPSQEYYSQYGTYWAAGGGGSGYITEVNLTKGTVVSVVVPRFSYKESASFGSYSVAPGGDGSVSNGGVASGNVASGGSARQVFDSESLALQYGTASGGGILGGTYGYGGAKYYNGTYGTYANTNSGSGCVYLKYIES